MKKTSTIQTSAPAAWLKRISVIIVVCSLFINMSLVTRAINETPIVEGITTADEQTLVDDAIEPQPALSLPVGDMSVEPPLPLGIPEGQCVSPLDFNDGAGGPSDGQVGEGDAVAFTNYYLGSYAKHSGDAGFDPRADVNDDGVVNGADFVCASYYYANNDNSCPINCERHQNDCHNPLDYNADYLITLDDGVNFTTYYENNNIAADLNGNGSVDYGDLLCSYDQLALNTYQCPVHCAPVCGDGIVQNYRGEQCDSGKKDGNEVCNAYCHEKGRCNVEVADYNHDGYVTLADAVTFTSYYVADPADMQADIDGNNVIDNDDYTCMLNFVNDPSQQPGETVKPSPRITPEPIKLPVEPSNGGGSSSGSYTAPEKPKVLGIELPVINFVGPLIQHLTAETPATAQKVTKAKSASTKKITLSVPAKTEVAVSNISDQVNPPVLVAGDLPVTPEPASVVTPTAPAKPWWIVPISFFLAW